MLRPTDRARLEAIAESDDVSISPRDRIEAIKMLHTSGDPIDFAQAQITRDVCSLSDTELEAALADYCAPLLTRTAPRDPIKMLVPDTALTEEQHKLIEERATVLAREKAERYLRDGIEDVERYSDVASAAPAVAHGDTRAEQDPTPPQDRSRAEKDAEVRRVFGGNRAPPGLDADLFRSQNDPGYRRRIRQHQPPW